MTSTDYFNLSILAETISQDARFLIHLLNGNRFVSVIPNWDSQDNTDWHQVIQDVQGWKEGL